MFLLVLMLDNPNLVDRILQAWADLGIRGAYMVEGASCRAPEPATPSRGPTGFLSFAHLLPARNICTVLLLAPVDLLATAERAAEEVARIAGGWGRPHGATMLALPVAASWVGVTPSIAGPEAEIVNESPPRQPDQPRDDP